MKLKYFLLIFACLLSTSPAWSSIFCPKSFNPINMGDTLDAVKASCGAPDVEKKYPADNSLLVPQQWDYYMQQNTRAQTTVVTGTLKMSIVFAGGKVINMSVNGIGVGGTQICGNSIHLGDSIQSVKKSCGQPVNIQVNNPPGVTPAPPPEITEWTYNGSPPTTLTFTDGKLTSRK